jgi:glycosyltransferase involved in cell wall biosynthesis
VSKSQAHLKVAIVHYWFVGFTGGEKVVEALAEIFPQADLFALVAKPECLPDTLRSRRLTTSFLQHIPGSRRWHRHFLPLQPFALEQMDLSSYDLIISSESGPAKGVLSSAGACHICYCHSPMRYLWDMYPSYIRSMNPLTRAIFSATAHYVRMWDLASASRVDYFVANSHYVASRIRKHYRRESSVIHPPVNVAAGYVSDHIEDYYLYVGRLIDYKRVDLAIQACRRLGRRLRIVGEGSQYKFLRRTAGRETEFLGHLEDSDLHKCYAHCRALLFPGEEDFGMVPVEAQSFGRPVVAYAKGGATETVRGVSKAISDSPEVSTGVFFDSQTEDSLVDAIRDFESVEHLFDPRFIRTSVERFGEARFKSRMKEFIESCLAGHSPQQPIEEAGPKAVLEART